jgi:hypothetical protein
VKSLAQTVSPAGFVVMTGAEVAPAPNATIPQMSRRALPVTASRWIAQP